jgi:hypothetical protein
MSNSQEILSGPYSRFYQRFGDPTVELHQAYDSWLADMASRPGAKLEPFEFDLGLHPEQSIYIPKIDVRPAHPQLPDSLYYPLFGAVMMRSLGVLATRRLVNQMQQPSSSEDPTPLAEKLNYNQREGKNTLVVTSHINFQEFGYVRGIRHIAKRDRQSIDKCGAVLNSLMTRQKYKGKKLVDRFTQIGNFYKSSPVSASAELHGIPIGASTLSNALFTKVLKADLESGGQEIDAALTGSEVKQRFDENKNFSHYFIPEVHPSSAKLVEGFDDVLGITLIGPPIIKSWQMHIGEMLDIRELLKTNSSAEVTDMIYGDIREALERFTGKDVVYHKVARQIGNTALDVDASD